MAIFSRYPYTDFHRLNADWILDQVKASAAAAAQAAEDAETAANIVTAYDTRLTLVEGDVAGTVRFDDVQELTDIQRTQARANIGAASTAQIISLGETAAGLGTRITTLETTSVSYTPQSATSTEKVQARTNIAAASAADVTQLTHDLQSLAAITVRVNSAQSFTDAQKLQARQNIGAASADSTPAGVVMYSNAQTLSDSEKSRARANIGALGYENPAVNETLSIMDDSVALGEGDEITLSVDSSTGHSIFKLEGDQSTAVRIAGVAAPEQDDNAVNKGYSDDHYDPLWHQELISGTTPTISLSDYDNRPILTCSECSSITLTGTVLPEFELVFDSGSTPTILALPASINMPADFLVNANTHYEINVRNTWGLYAAWEIEVTP